MFFDSWADLLRTFVAGTLAYAALILLLRISGKRSIAKLNIFDWVVTVALGSTLATVILSKDVALAEGAVAFGTLIGLQYLIAWLSQRSRSVRQLVKADPRLLYYRGRFLYPAMKDERVLEEEIRSVIRAQGLGSLQDAEAVVLETDGSFSVIKRGTSETGAGDALTSIADVKHQIPPDR